MTSLPPLAQTKDAERVAPPFAPAAVEDLLRLLVKAARAQQLYLPNNPIYRTALETLRNAFIALWADTDELALAVTETELRWYDVPVLAEGAKSSDNLAWLFYKDGVRELRFLPGVEDAEIVRFLELVQRARKAGTDSDDLVTMLWEADLSLLRYRYVDVLLEGTGDMLQDGGEALPPPDPGAVRAATQAAVEESRASGIVNMSDFDGSLYFLDPKEVEYLQDELAREYQQDLRTNVAAALLDIFEQQPDVAIRTEIIEDLEVLLVHMLTAAQFRSVGFLLSEVKATIARTPSLAPELQEALRRLPDRLSTGTVLTQLLQALDDAPSLPEREELSALFDELRPAALATVFQWLPRTRNDALRLLLEDVAGRLAAMNTAELVRLIQVPEPDVSSEAIRRAGALKAQAAVLSLSRVVAEAEPARRLLATQALSEIGSPGALQALEKVVEDADRDVRIAAVRALATRGYRPVVPRLEAIVRGKAIRDADLTEKTVFFEVYGALCGDGGIPHLDAVLNGKGFLGRREDPELRACAAVALGRIGTPRAMESLQRAGGDKDIVVRTAVARALRGSPP